MAAISVVICTHNPRPDYLRRVLDALGVQTLPRHEWELLMIDNASQTPLADKWDISWHPRARHVREDQLGLTPARLCGIRESSGELLVYVDDDNILAPDYLQTARTLMMNHPALGVIGAGILEPEFEVQPPPELAPHLHLLALRHVFAELWSTNTNDLACVPFGAGLCVRRHVTDRYRQLVERLNVTELLDRRGDRLFGDGDVAFSWASVAGGQGFGVFPGLRITHLLSSDRLTQRYFLRFACDNGFSGGVLHYLRAGILPGDSHGPVERWMRLALHGVRRGLFSMRLKRAALAGADAANHFIAQRRLQPLDHGGRQPGSAQRGVASRVSAGSWLP